MKITENISQILKAHKKSPSKFRTSHYPVSYQKSDIQEKIKTIRAYYKYLETPADTPKLPRNFKSPVKIQRPSRVPFVFRSHSTSKLLKEESPSRNSPSKINIRYFRSNSKLSDKFNRDSKQVSFSEGL